MPQRCLSFGVRCGERVGDVQCQECELRAYAALQELAKFGIDGTVDAARAGGMPSDAAVVVEQSGPRLLDGVVAGRDAAIAAWTGLWEGALASHDRVLRDAQSGCVRVGHAQSSRG